MTTTDIEPQLGTLAPRFVRFIRVINGAQSRTDGRPTTTKRLMSVNSDAVSAYEEAHENGCTRVYLIGRDDPVIVAHSFDEVARMLEG